MRSPFLIVFQLWLLSMLVSCTEESILPQPQYGTVSIKFKHTADGTEDARLEQNDPRKASHMVITVKGMDGQNTEYSEKKVEVYEFDGAYLVDNIVLPIGSYQISTLYLVDSTDNVLFATPNKDKSLAQNVKTPLPAPISSNKQINEVDMEVLSTKGLTPEDFGLESLDLQFDDTFYFFVGLSEKGKKLNFLSGEMTVTSEGYKSTQNIGAHAQKISLKRGYDHYNIKVENKDYHPFEGSFSYDSLKAHAATPLVIALERLNKPDGGSYVGNVALNTQQEVDDFGDNGYTKIEGRLSIGSFFPEDPNAITDLEPLQSILEVTNSLEIRNNKALTSLHGLHNLRSVPGYMSIDGNEILGSLAALKNLSIIGGGLTISNNNALTNLDGLQGLSHLSSNTEIKNNRNLVNLKGLDNIKTIGFFAISYNGKLGSFQGLGNVEQIGGLSITGHASLTSLSGFGNSISSLGHFYITGNPVLTDLKGMFSANGKIENSVTIDGNASLESLDGLEFHTDIVFSFEIKNNPLLNDISAMSDINTIGRDLIITDNKKLSSLTGLENLFSVGNLYRHDNDYILSIVNNTSLKDFCALSYLYKEGILYKQNIVLNAYNPTTAQMKAGECTP